MLTRRTLLQRLVGCQRREVRLGSQLVLLDRVMLLMVRMRKWRMKKIRLPRSIGPNSHSLHQRGSDKTVAETLRT
jgi:hypothetical protein